MNTIAPIMDGGPMMQMESRGYMPAYTQSSGGGGFFNTAMKIMGGVQSGLKTFQQFDTAFNANSVFRPRTTNNITINKDGKQA